MGAHVSIGGNNDCMAALFIGHAAIILAAVEELRIDKRLKNVVIRLSDFKSKRGVCCLRR